MKNYLNNKGMFILHYRPLALGSVLFVFFLFFCWILFPNRATSGPYLDSAHGSTYGVLRTSLSIAPNNYSRGNCAHCHEQHASIGGSEPDPDSGGPSKYGLFKQLFNSQEETFCFACHKDSSIQISMPNQYNYSRIAGGDTIITCPLSIKVAFHYVDISGNPSLNCDSNSGSSHFLEDIRSFIEKKPWGFTKGINPCSGCHNPHRAQKDSHTSTGRIVDGKLVSAVSLPSQHQDLTWGLWGDDTSERMNRYYYQAPCRYPRSNPCTSYEPDGSATTDGSNLVDYVTFCLDCHKEAISGTTRYIPPIDWGANGDIHGAASQYCKCDYADKRNPYNDGINYVLSCLDCHEPHGSPNEFLLRQGVNGSNNGPFASHQYYNFCLSCHRQIDKHTGGIPTLDPNDDCWGCHSHGATFLPEGLNRCTGCSLIEIKTF